MKKNLLPSDQGQTRGLTQLPGVIALSSPGYKIKRHAKRKRSTAPTPRGRQRNRWDGASRCTCRSTCGQRRCCARPFWPPSAQQHGLCMSQCPVCRARRKNGRQVREHAYPLQKLVDGIAVVLVLHLQLLELLHQTLVQIVVVPGIQPPGTVKQSLGSSAIAKSVRAPAGPPPWSPPALRWPRG